MRVIITGGTGLIGTALSTDLAKDGHEVIVLSRSPEHVKNLPAGVRAERWDAFSAEGWGALADGADAIVNLAGENLSGAGILPSRWTQERKHRILQSRVNAGQAVVQAVERAQHKPRLVVQSSGIGYYGPHGDEILTEADPPGDDFGARVAVQWEAASEPVEAMGVRRVIIRTSPVMARGEGILRQIMLPFQLFVGGPLGNGKQYLPWIHVADQVGAIRFLMDHDGASGPFNMIAPDAKTNAEFGKTLGSVMHRPYWFPLPAIAFQLAFGEVSTMVLTGQHAVPRKLLDMGYKFRFPELEGALRDLLG